MSSPLPPNPDNGFVGGYFSGLVDFRFTKFIGPRVMSVIYALAFALIVIGGIIFFFAGLSQGSGGAVVAILVVPLFVLLTLTYVRLLLELYLAILRTAENTGRASQLLQAHLSSAQGASPATGGYGPPPGSGPGYGPPPGSGPGYGPPPGSGPGYGPGTGYGPATGPGQGPAQGPVQGYPPPGGQYPYGQG